MNKQRGTCSDEPRLAVAVPHHRRSKAWTLPSRGIVGMACLIVAESAIFIIFVVAYIFYIGKSLSGPTPREVLELPIFATICLLSSSITVHFAVHAARGQIRPMRRLARRNRSARQHLSRRHGDASGIT